MTLSLVLLLGCAAPPPTPTPAGAQTAGGPTVKVEVAQPASIELRRAFPNLASCVEVPPHLFRRPSWADSVAEGRLFAGAGKVVGVLKPPQGGTMRLRLFHGEKLTQELFLPPPAGQAVSLPAELFLDPRAQIAAVRFREGTAVYAGSTLTYFQTISAMPTPKIVLTSDEVHWFPWPEESGSQLKTAKELPALWVKGSLDGGEQEVLLRVDGKHLDVDHPFADEWALAGALRGDGKLWLVGLQSGEAMVATRGGRILRRGQIPYRFPTEHEVPELVEKTRQQAMREVMGDPLLADATRKPPKESVVWVRGRTRIFWSAYARDNDLVLLTTPFTQPANAVLWFTEELTNPPRCFWFHDIAHQELRVAVTAEALWLVEPLGFVPWEDLEHWWESTQKQDESRPAPSYE